MNYLYENDLGRIWLKNVNFFQIGKLYAIGIFCKFKYHNDMMNDSEFTGEMEDYLFSHKWDEYQDKMEDLVKNGFYPLKTNSFWDSVSDICIDLDSSRFRKFCYFEPFTVLSIGYLSYEACVLHIMQTCNGNTEIGYLTLKNEKDTKSKFFFNGLFLNIEDIARGGGIARELFYK